jgi:hypothetical protein
LRLRLPTPGLVGSPEVHSSCLAPVSFAGFLIKCLRVHWHALGFRPGLPPCRFAWPFSRRLGSFRPRARGVLSPVSSPSLCQICMSAAELRCDTAVFRHLGHIRPWGAGPLCFLSFLGLPPGLWAVVARRCRQTIYRLSLCMGRSPASSTSWPTALPSPWVSLPRGHHLTRQCHRNHPRAHTVAFACCGSVPRLFLTWC